MADREKVIQWLEACSVGCEEGCSYEYDGLVSKVECKADLMRDALELLKAQEPVEPIRNDIGIGYWYQCGSCGAALGVDWKYCHNCGKAVKWDG